jgi:probable HAF family extracellular repeat protein
MKPLGTLGGIYSAAFGLNNTGQVVGASTRADGEQVAFLWRNDQMLDLANLLPEGHGWRLNAAYDVDDLGVIVGEGVRPDGRARAFLLTPAAALDAPTGRGAVLRFAGAVPNPVRDRARFSFELPAAGRASLTIYDLAGRVVRELASGWFAAGPASLAWDGRGDDGAPTAPGAYLARLVTEAPAGSGARSTVRRFVRVR